MRKRLYSFLIAAVLGYASPSQGQSPSDSKRAEQAMMAHPGWSAMVVASDPVVVDPVAIRFDRHRRLWVVEMSDYPTGPKPGQPPAGRIRILEDRDDDGRYETATTFADQLLFPTGVQPWRDGAVVTLAGKIVWMQDQDADGVAEKSAVWFEGFAMDNEQLRANHPVLGPDGMIYVAGGLRGGKVRAVDARFAGRDRELDLRDHDFCFDPDGGDWRAVMGNSQFGMTIDDFGRRIGCSNRNPAFTRIVDDAAVARDVLIAPRDAIDDVAKAGEASYVNPRTKAWTTSNLHAGQFSAACGVVAPGWFGDADQDGEWLLVCEPTGSLVQRQWIANVDGSWKSSRDPRTEEFLSSTDSWFRPVDIVAGPDHAVYISDMVRAVIEHPQWAPTELKDRPDTWDGSDQGRVWKIASEQLSAPEPAGTPDVSWLGHSNPWLREMATQYFFEAESHAVADSMRGVIARSTSEPVAVARAAQWLAARQSLDPPSLQRLLQHDHHRVVAVGISVIPAAVLQDQPWGPLTGHEQAAVRLAVAARLAATTAADTETIRLLLVLAKRDGAGPAASKVLGSADSSLLAELSRLGAADQAIATPLLTHWWTRWAVDAAEDALRALVALASRLDDQRTVALLDAWIRGNQITGAKRMSQQNVRAAIGEDPLERLRGLSEKVALDPGGSGQIRSAAIRAAVVVGDLPKTFASLLNDEQPIEVRTVALSALFASDPLATCDRLADQLLTLPPALRATAIDLLVSRPDSTRWLLDRIESGAFRSSLPGPQVAKRLIGHRDTAIATRAKKLFSISSDREALMARYRGSSRFGSDLTQADAHRGKLVFAQACAVCHRIDDIGVNVGPDISDSRDKTPDILLASILDPNAAIDAAYFQYSALTSDGRILDGLLVDDRPEGVTLRRQGGENVFVPRSDLDQLQASGASLMPDGFERQINEDEMANLIAYLKNWRYLEAKAP